MSYYKPEKKPDFFICDTTLRDGEQVADVRYTPEQKEKIAVQMAETGVESIDAGFAATSEEERESIRRITSLGLDMRIMSMCRVVQNDIDHARSCNVDGVILFIPGSDVHLKAKFGGELNDTRRHIVDNAVNTIKYAKDKGLFVEFGVEDSTRTDPAFLIEVLQRAEESGADLLGTTDTVGFLTPEKTYNFISNIVSKVNKPVGVHCHNDFGLATANTVSGLLAGGGYCSPTVNGMGERSGNASLEEVIMIMKVLYKMDLPYDTKKLTELSKMVQEYSRVGMDIMKPIVGENAFSHESGIHIHGMIKDVNTYEVFDPELVGRERKYVFGKHAGKNTIKYVLAQYGYEIDDEECKRFWDSVKANERVGVHYTIDDILKEYNSYKKGE